MSQMQRGPEALEDELQAIAGLVTSPYDYFALTYVASGNGVGKIETMTFKLGGSGGTTVATITCVYNSDHKIISVTKT